MTVWVVKNLLIAIGAGLGAAGMLGIAAQDPAPFWTVSLWVPFFMGVAIFAVAMRLPARRMA